MAKSWHLLWQRPLSFASIADVAVNRLWQRLKTGPPWKVCGTVGFLWTVVCIAVNSIDPLSPRAYSLVSGIYGLLAIPVGFWSIWREPESLRLAVHATLKSTMLAASPEILIAVLWTLNLLHPTLLNMQGHPVVHGSRLIFLSARGDMAVAPMELLIMITLIVGATSLFLGFIGASLGRIANAVKSGYQGA